MTIKRQTVEHVAHLARINLSEQEIAKFQTQLGDILNYIDKLKKVDISKVQPTSHVLPLKNVYRQDRVKPSLPVDAVLQNAPSKKNDFFTVPRVIEEI
jgi:aspartyl-tRNA(Asn)/glutamyl-tRNA(Gln) amidotransferase subunit C